ncbi:MAG: trigger factor [Phycisphaeraceae bacterium]|nr:trigger factor [Phycisphaeraceae bacterium]
MAKQDHTHHDHASHDHAHHDHDHHDHDHDQVPLAVAVEDIGPARKCLTIEVPAARIETEIENRYSNLQEEAALPGFRRGKAPKRLLQRRFSSTIRDEVRTALLSSCYSQAIEQEKLEVLGEPEIPDLEQIKLPEQGPLVFKVQVEVVPKFDLPELKSLAVKKPKVELSDQDVTDEVERMRRQFGELLPVTEGTIEEDDYLLSDVKILAGDDAPDGAEELAQHPGTYILVPSKSREYKGHVVGIVVENLGKKLLGKKVHDVLRLSLKGPAAHEDARIKDQPITLVITIQKIERIQPATLEAVSARVGLTDASTLTTRVREMLDSRRQREQQSAMHQQICDHLLDAVEMDLPEGLSTRQAARMLQRQAIEMIYRGMPEDEVGQKIAELRSGTEDQARKQLKLYFILSRAAESLQIQVSEAEVNGRVAMLAMQQGRRPERFRQEMQRSGQLEQLYVQIRDQKTLDKILESATVTEVDPKELAESAPAAKKKSPRTSSKSKKGKAKGKDESADSDE